MTYEQRREHILELWNTCLIRPEKLNLVQRVADRIKQGENRYRTVQNATGVPWFIVGCIHNMESSCRWNTYLHNGDPLADQFGTPIKTAHVPAGVGPFGSFEEAAIDALKRDRFAGVNAETPIERYLYLLEGFNGYGYVAKGINSPYLWSYTNHYGAPPHIGRYVADHVFDANSISDQVGCAAVLRLMWNEETNNKPEDIPPSNPHLWNSSIFIRKMDEYFTDSNTTHEKYKDLQEIWPKAKQKILDLTKNNA